MYSKVKKSIFPLAVLAAVLLVTACPQPDYFISGSGSSSCCTFDNNGGYSHEEDFPETSAEVTVWIIDAEGAMLEYENLQAALDWLKDNAVNGGNYTVRLGRDQIIAPQTLSYGASVSITFNGVRGEKQISPSKIGSLFTIGAGVTLTLDRGITLKGLSSNLVPLVSVEKNGTLVMKDGSVIRDNDNTRRHLFTSNGAGVSVAGKFTMDGGSILNNKAPGLCTGGGVIIIDAGEFTMNGGLISGNEAESKGGGVGFYHSIISEERAVFLMTGGVITNNVSGSGGGVYVSDFGNFTMTGGTISNNSASAGGGVYVGGYAYGGSGEFIMTGGVICNNLAEINGGGIFSQYAHKDRVVIGGNAVISRNEANTANPFRGNSSGGGIYTSSIILEGNCVIEGNKARKGAGVYLTYHESIKTVTFTMTGGVIRSNTAVEYGGGVAFNYLSQGQARDYAVPFAFEKTGGTIYGYDGGANANIVLNAVNKDGRPRPSDDEDDQGEDNDNQGGGNGGVSIVPYGNDQGNNNNQGGNGNGNSQGNGNQGNQGNGNGNGNNQGNGNGNNQGNNGNGNNNNQGNDDDQGEDDDDQGGNGGALADKGYAVFVFDLYWGQSYSGSDDVSTVYVRKETTSPPADRLGAWDNEQPQGAWD